MANEQLTSEQIRDKAIEQFTTFARYKYDKGHAEHGGSILDRCMIDDMEAEIVDMWFYLQALKIKLQKLEPKDK